MKTILINNTIYVLDNNIRRIYKKIKGTGAKSNPFHYYINIDYHDKGTFLITEEFETEKEMNDIFNEIYTIMKED